MIESVLNKLEYFIQLQGWKGWDPYDALNSDFIKILTFGRKKLRIAAIQFIRRSPINFRPILGVPKGTNPKGMGLFASAYLSRFEKTKREEYSCKAKKILDWLIKNYSTGYRGICWGYNFDWQSRAFFLPRYTPTVVNTSFIGRAFIKAYDVLGDSKYLRVARSACDFILNDLNRFPNSQSEIRNPHLPFCFSYSPIDHYYVHNATALASSLLALMYERTGERKLFEIAKRSIQYVASYQREDGSWYYGEDDIAKRTGIDNFHTGFILESLKIYAQATGDKSFDEQIKRGLKFYQKNFFLSDGAPKYYYNKIYPLDIHSAAQSIVTLIQLREYGADMDLCQKVAQWMIKNMQDKQGYFYYQKGSLLTNKIPYIRWSQAWAYYALTYYFTKIGAA